jgi:hypothetical protein
MKKRLKNSEKRCRKDQGGGGGAGRSVNLVPCPLEKGCVQSCVVAPFLLLLMLAEKNQGFREQRLGDEDADGHRSIEMATGCFKQTPHPFLPAKYFPSHAI